MSETEGAVRGETRSRAPPGGGGGLSPGLRDSGSKEAARAQPEDAPPPRGTAAQRPCGEGAASLATPRPHRAAPGAGLSSPN